MKTGRYGKGRGFRLSPIFWAFPIFDGTGRYGPVRISRPVP